jgi:hypothetical protein
MDNSILKKRLATFKTKKGTLKNVTDELLRDLLHAWESWQGTPKEFYRSIGVSQAQMAKLMGKAKKLKREGIIPENNFKEIQVEPDHFPLSESCPACVELVWDGGKIIRFSQVELLVEFLKKAA